MLQWEAPERNWAFNLMGKSSMDEFPMLEGTGSGRAPAES